MSTSTVSPLVFVSKQIAIYGGVFLMVTGLLGGFLNGIVFLSLRTFRQSSCAFYLTIMSIANIGQLFFGMFIQRLLVNIFGIDLTAMSLIYCKCQSLLLQICALTSLTCLCLATIDQYCATCSRRRWQQFCNIKLARCVTAISIFIVILYGIPLVIYSDQVQSSATSKITCTITNAVFVQYRAYIQAIGLVGFVPVIIVVLFGGMAYRNIQQLAYRTVPLVRRELDKQLTIMVLVQIVVNAFGLIPQAIQYTVSIVTNRGSDPIFQLILSITNILFYVYFAVSFH
jgi:hypothetical protein